MQPTQPKKISLKRVTRLIIYCLAGLLLVAGVARLSYAALDVVSALNEATTWPTLGGADPCIYEFQSAETYTVTTSITTDEFLADIATRWQSQGWKVAVSSDHIRLKATKDNAAVNGNLRRTGQTIFVSLTGNMGCK